MFGFNPLGVAKKYTRHEIANLEKTSNLYGAYFGWELGTIGSTGALSTSANTIRTSGYIKVSGGETIKLNNYDTYKIAIVYYDEQEKFKANTGWLLDDATVPYAALAKLAIRRVDNAAITIDDAQSIVPNVFVQNYKILDVQKYNLSDDLQIMPNPKDANVKAIAHRGYSDVAPENTLPAFKLAKKMGFSFVEADVRFSSDGIPVIIHDATVDRTSNGTGNVADKNLAQLQALDFGGWKSANYTGIKIPTFEEFLQTCMRYDLFAYVELKIGVSSEQATTLINMTKTLGMVERVFWIASIANLSTMLAVDPNARLTYLTADLTQQFVDDVIAEKTTTNNVSILTRYNTVTDELIESALLSDVPVMLYLVNDPQLVAGLVNKGISGIFTDSLNIMDILLNV